MQSVTSATAVATTARANDITLFASLELSKSKLVATINGPGGASAARCSRSAFSIPIGSGACSAAKAPGITIRFGEIVSNGSRRCEPATAVSCRRC